MGNSSSWPAPSVPGSTEPNSVHVEVDVDQVECLSHTQGFDADEYLVPHQDTEFPLMLHCNSQPRVEVAKLVHASGRLYSWWQWPGAWSAGLGSEYALYPWYAVDKIFQQWLCVEQAVSCLLT